MLKGNILHRLHDLELEMSFLENMLNMSFLEKTCCNGKLTYNFRLLLEKMLFLKIC